MPLCLLTPDMQNRRIIDQLLRQNGVAPEPTLESDSIVVLISHVQTGRWASVMPEQSSRKCSAWTTRLRAIPIVEPEEAIGLAWSLPDREPAIAAARRALVAERGCPPHARRT